MKTLNLLFISIILISNCIKNPVALDPKGNFSIHLLKDPSIKFNPDANLDLSNIEIDPTPWISSKDIEFYDYSTHFIYLKTKTKDYFPDIAYSYEQSWHFRPFVVYAFGKACYAGYISISINSLMWYDIYISDYNLNESENILNIRNSKPSVNSVPQSGPDSRNNIIIKNALIEDGIYHAGLDVKINNVSIFENSDTATVQYSYSITNDDQDDLYVFDSEAMKKEILNLAVRLIFYDEYYHGILPIGYEFIVEHEILENWKSSWFTKVNSKQSITRTVICKYPGIPAGHYHCLLVFINQFKFKKNEYKLSDGRYWLGATRSELLDIVVK